MHDMDRTQQFLESDPSLELETDQSEFEQGSSYEFENLESDLELESDFEQEPEFEGPQDSESGMEGENDGQELGEELETELAAELLSAQSEQELDQFLGKFIKKGLRRARGFVRSGAGRALLSSLKGVAMQAVPGLSAVQGLAALHGAASSALSGLSKKQGETANAIVSNLSGELEGLSAEEQEWEIARGVVRLADRATDNMANLVNRGVANASNATQAATSAIRNAERAVSSGVGARASQFERGLQRAGQSVVGHARGRCRCATQGRWVREGNRIILFGVRA